MAKVWAYSEVYSTLYACFISWKSHFLAESIQIREYHRFRCCINRSCIWQRLILYSTVYIRRLSPLATLKAPIFHDNSSTSFEGKSIKISVYHRIWSQINSSWTQIKCILCSTVYLPSFEVLPARRHSLLVFNSSKMRILMVTHHWSLHVHSPAHILRNITPGGHS